MSRREISAGCVVYRTTESQTEVALIQPRDRKAWALPKGLIEPGEPPEAGNQRVGVDRDATGLLVDTRREDGLVIDREDPIADLELALGIEAVEQAFRLSGEPEPVHERTALHRRRARLGAAVQALVPKRERLSGFVHRCVGVRFPERRRLRAFVRL